MDSSDQIEIRIFEIHNLNVFLGEDLKKVLLTSSFSKKSGTSQMSYMYDIKNEPMLVARLINFSYILFHVCHLFKLLVDCF